MTTKRRKPTQTEPERTARKVEQPPTEKPELIVEEPVAKMGNMKTRKGGTPTLGRTPNYVETVGLGKLEVITAHGNTDV